MPDEPIKDSTGKQIGTWTYDCKTGVNDPVLTGVQISMSGHVKTGAKSIADAAAAVAKSVLTILNLPAGTEQQIVKIIDTAASLFPGAKLEFMAGTFPFPESPECKQGPDKCQYLKYSIFEGVIVGGEGKLGPADLDGALRVGQVLAHGYHKCDCKDTLSMVPGLVGGDPLAMLQASGEASLGSGAMASDGDTVSVGKAATASAPRFEDTLRRIIREELKSGAA